MTHPTSAVSKTLVMRPPLPSITASALLESRRLAAAARRAIAAWLVKE
jgi:hypothetical protein